MLQKLAGFVFLSTVLSACGGGADAPAEAPAEGVIALTGARLIDGNGGAPIENAVVVIRGDRIESVGAAASTTVPEGAEVIDVTGKTIMPGIINLHMHLALMGDGLTDHADNFNEQNIQAKLEQYARYGVLHVVSRGWDKPLIYDIRERQRNEGFPGARVYTMGRGFGVPGGYPPGQPGSEGELDVYRPTTPEEAREFVRELAPNRPDGVKMWFDDHLHTMPAPDADIFRAIVDEAHKQNLPAFAHVHYLDLAKEIVDAGVDGLLHSVRDLPVDSALVQAMRERDVYSVSTLVREEVQFSYADGAPYMEDPFFAGAVNDSVMQILRSPEYQQTKAANPEIPAWRAALDVAKQNLVTLFNSGVKIGFGSDSGVPGRFEGYMEHRELELMQEAGLTPAQIIQIASKNSAEILGIEADYGTIEAGKMAEFLVLGANPLETISNTKSLEEVWQEGERRYDLR